MGPSAHAGERGQPLGGLGDRGAFRCDAAGAPGRGVQRRQPRARPRRHGGPGEVHPSPGHEPGVPGRRRVRRGAVRAHPHAQGQPALGRHRPLHAQGVQAQMGQAGRMRGGGLPWAAMTQALPGTRRTARWSWTS